ncbi:MAG: NUDIX hydrolase [Acidobacteriota bacterium]|nr:NUDIX hydrolase [Acidobacteriota bacterium]
MDCDYPNLREQRIDGKTVYEGRILDLEVDRVELPNGGEALREVIRHRGAVVVLPLLPDGRIVFVRQHRYPTGEVLLELPAGKLDPGESPVVCAVRELEEETGWRAANTTSLGWFYTTPGFTDEVLHSFVATGLEAASDHAPDPDEAIEIITWEVDHALEACRDGGIRDSKTIAVLFQARLHGYI